jgi:hypothetical protein
VSDESQGPGWWLASDGKWYPPELAPGAVAPAGPLAPTTVDVGSAFSYAWKKFQQYTGPLLLIALFVALVYLVFALISFSVDSVAGRVVFEVISFFVGQVVTLGLYRAALMVTAGETPELGKVFTTDRLGEFIIGSLLYALIVVVGLILCIVPGVIAAVMLYFYGFYILDRNLSATDALRASYDLVRTHAGPVVALLLVALLVYFVGFLLCGIGVLVTGPIALIMVAYGYRVLNNEPVAP